MKNGDQAQQPVTGQSTPRDQHDKGMAEDRFASHAVAPGQAFSHSESMEPVPDSDIPWRNMPSLPSSEPLAAGTLPEAPGKEEPTAKAPEPDPDSVWDKALPEAVVHHEADAQYELVLGAKLRQYGPVFFFRAGQENVNTGLKVLVETGNGIGLAEVTTVRRLRLPLPMVKTEKGDFPIKPILGLAGPEDIAAAADNQILAASAKLYCKECIRERKLDMKLVDVEVLHDRSKIIFYFTAPTRIDFRELVKDLVRNYHTRIELRQIGVRHETQMLGALGNCGMTCCCRRYLRKFAPVTIRMAKEQNLFLNPAKLSGICGRLLCCLAYEQENYEDFHKRSPQIGKRYTISSGHCKVLRANMFRQSIVILTDANEEKELSLEEWEALAPERMEQYGAGGNAPGGGDAPEKRGRNREAERDVGKDKKRDGRSKRSDDEKKQYARFDPDSTPGTSVDDELRKLEDEDDASAKRLSRKQYRRNGPDKPHVERSTSGKRRSSGQNSPGADARQPRDDRQPLRPEEGQPQRPLRMTDAAAQTETENGGDSFEDDGSIFGLKNSNQNDSDA